MIKFRYLLVLLISFFLLNGQLYSQENEDENNEIEEDKYWEYSGLFSKVFNQSSFTNWASGGENSLSATSITELEANYDKDNISFENSLDLRYGLYQTEETPLRKNEDRIELISKFGREIVPKLNSSAMITFRSQFAKGYDYPNDSVMVSRFMAPGFLTLSAGFDYKPRDYLSIFVAPVAGRFTFVIDNQLASKGAFGVDKTQNSRAELGAMITIGIRKIFLDENLRFRSRVDIFNAYKLPNKKVSFDWKSNVINWETSFNIKITEYITANLLLHMIHDHNITVPKYQTIDGVEVVVDEEQLQFKQTFGLGFSYSF